jgi:hypothetical protein
MRYIITMLKSEPSAHPMKSLSALAEKAGRRVDLTLFLGKLVCVAWKMGAQSAGNPTGADERLVFAADPFFVGLAVRRISSEQKLSTTWLHDEVNIALLGAAGEPAAIAYPSAVSPIVRIFAPSVANLVALKMMASLGDGEGSLHERDLQRILMVHGITSSLAAKRLIGAIYPLGQLPRALDDALSRLMGEFRGVETTTLVASSFPPVAQQLQTTES